MPQTTDSTSRRRRFRFSLRTLLIVFLLLSLPLGWFALKMRRAERQRQAVEAIQKAGGYVFYDYECSGGVPIPDREPPVPASLRELLGQDFFADVVQFGYFGEIGDVGLEHVKGLPSLQVLNLNCSLVTDAGLVHLKGLTELQRLHLNDTEVTDTGLVHLKALGELEILRLFCTHVTDAGIEHLTGLTNLDLLDLDGTHVTEEGIEKLRKALPNCEIVWEKEHVRPTRDEP